MGSQGTTERRNIAKNFNRLSRCARTLQTDDRRQTDGRTMTYSEHELEFTFAKKSLNFNNIINSVYYEIRKRSRKKKSYHMTLN